MHKREITLRDGRYLVFYSFDGSPSPPPVPPVPPVQKDECSEAPDPPGAGEGQRTPPRTGENR